MSNLKQKLSSRKLWAAIAGILIGAGTIITGALNGDTEVIKHGVLITGASPTVYMTVEALVDAFAALARKSMNTTEVTVSATDKQVVKDVLIPTDATEQ